VRLQPRLPVEEGILGNTEADVCATFRIITVPATFIVKNLDSRDDIYERPEGHSRESAHISLNLSF